MHRRWLVNRTNPEYIQYLSKTAVISPLLAQILVNRGIKTPEAITSCLNPHISQLSDPFGIEGMKTAVERIQDACRKGEKILVHGDYDVDGITATAILLKALKMLGMEGLYFIPNRMEHGYGFNPSSVKKAKQAGAALIITVDCGITSFETCALCKKEGIDVIITDHHEPEAAYDSPEYVTAGAGKKADSARHIPPPPPFQKFRLPDAVAVVNPKISDVQSPASDLSGAGIAFKVSQALALYAETTELQCAAENLLDLAALGTISDVVPLTNENRIIVKEGLRLINDGARPGLQALKRVSGIEGKRIKPGLLLFTVIPRINAAGRISDANDVIRLLLTESLDEATDLAVWLDNLNYERQQQEEIVYQQALAMLHSKTPGPVIILSSEGWHKGVIGIVASRVAEAFNRPAFIFSIEEGIARGSARSIPSFNLFAAVTECRNFLRKFGGHKQAAGLELEVSRIPPFEEAIKRIADERLSEKELLTSLEIDADVDFADIGLELAEELGRLEPFGFGNPEPLLGSKGLEVLYPKIVKDRHLKMKLRQKNFSIDAIGFDMAAVLDKIKDSSAVDAVFTPTVNEWEGNRTLQLNLKALRPGS
jgi:single-stranded-DNA-specific exonuclease